MTAVGELERKTQRRVIRHFRDHLGYTFLGNWHERDNNRNIETEFLTKFLARQGHSPASSPRRSTSSARLPPSAGARPSTTPTARSTASFATASRSGPASANTRSPFT